MLTEERRKKIDNLLGAIEDMREEGEGRDAALHIEEWAGQFYEAAKDLRVALAEAERERDEALAAMSADVADVVLSKTVAESRVRELEENAQRDEDKNSLYWLAHNSGERLYSVISLAESIVPDAPFVEDLRMCLDAFRHIEGAMKSTSP